MGLKSRILEASFFFRIKEIKVALRDFFFLISNKTSLILKKRHPIIQGVYKGEQIKNENYKSQVNPKEKKNGFSTQRTSQVRFRKKEA